MFCLHSDLNQQSTVSQPRPQHTELPSSLLLHSTLNNQTPNIYQQCRKTWIKFHNYFKEIPQNLPDCVLGGIHMNIKASTFGETTAGTNILSVTSGMSRISHKHLINLQTRQFTGKWATKCMRRF